MTGHPDHEQLELMVNIKPEAGQFAEPRQHLKDCADCREKFYLIKEFDMLIRRDMNAVPIPPYLVDQILNRINTVAGKKSP